MKKLFALALIAAVSAAAIGCGGTTASTAPATKPGTAKTEVK